MYEKQNWIDGKSPLNAERMNHIEDGIGQISEAVEGLGASGGASGGLDLIVFTYDEDTGEVTCNKTHDECWNIVGNGIFIALYIYPGYQTQILPDCVKNVMGADEYKTNELNFFFESPNGMQWGRQYIYFNKNVTDGHTLLGIARESLE